jgi:hypothetical protein
LNGSKGDSLAICPEGRHVVYVLLIEGIEGTVIALTQWLVTVERCCETPDLFIYHYGRDKFGVDEFGCQG